MKSRHPAPPQLENFLLKTRKQKKKLKKGLHGNNPSETKVVNIFLKISVQVKFFLDNFEYVYKTDISFVST